MVDVFTWHICFFTWARGVAGGVSFFFLTRDFLIGAAQPRLPVLEGF
jgi:hypothetical protein